MMKKRVLLTGGAGFIGSHVVDVLIASGGYTVVVLDKLCYCASKQNVNPAAIFELGDILEYATVLGILEKHSIDVVMHFAAETHVDNSFNNSVHFTHTNVVGTHVLLEAVRANGRVEKFIHVSTDEVYGSPADIESTDLFSEHASLLQPTNPYAASKAAAEMIVHAYKQSYKLPVVITRCNNVYGPRQYPEKIIPLFFKQVKAGKPLTLHGTGQNRRAYLYVTDAARAFLAVLEHGVTGQVYNIGRDEELTNLDVAQHILRHEPATAAGVVHVPDRTFNDTRYPLDLTKIRALGWQPVVGWEAGLHSTLEWYKAHPGYFDKE